MVWLPWFWLLLVLEYPATGQDKHYMGGSISFTSSDGNAFSLTVVTGWKLGEGPCGLMCDQRKIGTNTNETRRQMERDHGNSYFGQWNVSVTASTFHEYLKGMSSYTLAVNKAGLWEQEVMETDVLLGVSEQEEIRLSGLYWIPFKYKYVENASSVLQVDLKAWTRNDTGLPNNSPVVMFKPLYRITLNKATKIDLSTRDKDDDFVRCEMSPSTLTAVKTMPNTTISKDCSVTVEAYEGNGFLDKGYGVVTLVARDFNRHVLAVGGEIRTIGDTRPLSTVHVQFMVETVKVDEGPSFLSPTRESQHVFVVYTGSVLEIPLYATDGSQIKFLARSVPNRQFNVHATQTVTHDGKKMSSTTVTWEPTREDAGVYLFSASVIDSTGRDGLDRNYKIIVKDAERAGEPKSSPYYVKETVKGPVQCLQHATCTFFVSVATESDGDPVLKVTESHVSTAQVEIGTPQKRNDAYTSYISLTSGTIDTFNLCLKAIGTNGSQSKDFCLPIHINPTDPCEFPPCVHGVCESEKEQCSCTCEEGYTGRLCDTAITTTTTTVTTTTTKSKTISTTVKTTPTSTITTPSSTTKITTTTNNQDTTTPTTTSSPTTTTIMQTAPDTTPTITTTYRTSTPHTTSTSTPKYPLVHLSPPSTSGFPYCSEVVNQHPSRQCICLSDNQLIQCPIQKSGTVNSQEQDDTGSTSVLIPVLGCVAGLTGIVAIFVIKRFCCPCSKINKVSADSLESLKQEDEERYVERKPRRHHPQHQRNIPQNSRKSTTSLTGDRFP